MFLYHWLGSNWELLESSTEAMKQQTLPTHSQSRNLVRIPRFVSEKKRPIYRHQAAKRNSCQNLTFSQVVRKADASAQDETRWRDL